MTVKTASPAQRRGFLQFDDGFETRCAEAFYENLLKLMPMARDMFRDPVRQRSMFAVMLKLIMKLADNRKELGQALEKLGLKHRELGIQSLHLKVGRKAFLNAVESAAPDISDDECAFFERTYDQMVVAMQGRPSMQETADA